MPENDRRLELTGGSSAAFVPAVLLVVAVVLLMNTSRYDVFGLYAIFTTFAGGLILAVLSVTLRLFSERPVGTPLRIALSIAVSAVLLYLVYGCVFGCPG